MKIWMEVTGDRETIARLEKISADVNDRVRGAVSASAQDIQHKASMRGSVDAKITPDSDDMGATIGPLPASEKVDEDAAIFQKAVEKAVDEVVGG